MLRVISNEQLASIYRLLMYADDEDAMLIMAISCPLASDNHVQISFASHLIIRMFIVCAYVNGLCIFEVIQFRCTLSGVVKAISLYENILQK